MRLGICVCCSATRISLLGVLKSKWSLVCCSKILSIQSLIPTPLGHKPSSTNFVVMFDIVESVITVEVSSNIMKGAEYILSVYTIAVLTEEYQVILIIRPTRCTNFSNLFLE